MKGTSETPNVVYLPAYLPAPAAAPPPARRPPLTPALRRAWWRLRISVIEIAHALRPQRHPVVADALAARLTDASELGVRPRPTRPALVIDLEVARARLRRLDRV
jgi:hypothetical protein